MGFRNGKITRNIFTPEELTEGVVQAIHYRCLLEKPEVGIRTAYAQVFKKSSTGKETPFVRFKKEALEKDRENIEFLLGQIKAVHSGSRILPFDYGMVHYSGKVWTTDSNILIQLYELGLATGNLTPFVRSEKKKFSLLLICVLLLLHQMIQILQSGTKNIRLKNPVKSPILTAINRYR